MRLSLGEIAGIGPKPSNSDAFWTTAPRRRRNTAKPRRILDHYGPRTATHHITATAEDTTDPQQDARCSTLVASGRLRAGRVAIPVSPAALAGAMARTRIDAPAIARAGAVIAHFRQYEVFSPASAAVGAGLARWILVSNGVDPTGTAVVSAADALDPVGAARALAGWASGDEAGVGEWLVHVAQCVEYGARIGRDIAVHVQARTLGD